MCCIVTLRLLVWCLDREQKRDPGTCPSLILYSYIRATPYATVILLFSKSTSLKISEPFFSCHIVSCCFMLFQRLLVSVDHWPADSLSPLGHYVRVLGKDGDKDVETQVHDSLIEELNKLLAQ